jgi:hypothetical protein
LKAGEEKHIVQTPKLGTERAHLRLIRFRQPNSTASFSEIVFTISCLFSSLISTKQGAPILKGKAVSSLTFVGI